MAIIPAVTHGAGHLARHSSKIMAGAGEYWARAATWMGGHKLATGAIAAGTVATGYVATTAIRNNGFREKELQRRSMASGIDLPR